MVLTAQPTNNDANPADPNYDPNAPAFVTVNILSDGLTYATSGAAGFNAGGV